MSFSLLQLFQNILSRFKKFSLSIFHNFFHNQIRIAIIILVIAAMLICGGLWLRFLNKPLFLLESTPVDFVFTQGTSVTVLAKELKQRGILQHPNFFIWLAKLEGKSKKLQAGEYHIVPNITPRELLNMLAEGKSIKHESTIVEGWTFKQVRAALSNNSYLAHETQGLSDDAIMKKIGHEGEMPEGRFAPDTYVFSGKVSDLTILQSAYDLMQKRLILAWKGKATNALYQCSYEALIVASMIEKESADFSERPKIAGVIMRRLQVKMPLQIDASVIYGLGDKFSGKLSERDLKIDTGYNTYLHQGLPRAPISMPSQNAINAALHPAYGTELYYVAKGGGEASHVFSNTLDEHKAAKQELKEKLQQSSH